MTYRFRVAMKLKARRENERTSPVGKNHKRVIKASLVEWAIRDEGLADEDLD